jgi:tetratricopeptide (TPR) repeat protein
MTRPLDARFAIVALALGASVVVAYWPAGGHDFVNFDDPLYVTANREVQAGLTAGGVAWAFTTLRGGNWHPLTWLSHMLDVSLFGLHAGRHHLTSVAIHGANAVLLLWVLVRMTGAFWQAAFVAALFALHPLHVESVAWVAERKDVLCTLFFLLMLWAYARFVERPGAGRYALLVLAFVLGLASKAMIVTAPAVLLLLDLWPLGRLAPAAGRQRAAARLASLVAEKLPLLALAALVAGLTFLAQRRGGTMSTTDTLAAATRVGHAAVAYFEYLALALWPRRLAVFYPYPAVLPAWQALGAGALLVALTAGALGLARTRPYLLVGWGWYVVTLLPVIGLVQVGMHSIADRYTYVPLIGIFVVAAWGAPDLLAGLRWRRAALAAAAALALVAAAAATRAQVGRWKDDVTLYEHALAVTDGNFLAHNNLGLALVRAGRIAEARPHFEEAVRLKPRYLDARNNLGGTLVRAGRLDEAAVQFAEVLRIAPSYAPAHRNLATVLAQQGRGAEAQAHLEEAARLDPRGAAR